MVMTSSDLVDTLDNVPPILQPAEWASIPEHTPCQQLPEPAPWLQSPKPCP
jgi:hypothetical protein